MTARTPKRPRPGTIAVAGLHILEGAARELTGAQLARLRGTIDAICESGANVSAPALAGLVALAKETPREAPPVIGEAPDLRVCDWCGQSFSGRAWGNASGVFCSEEDAAAASRAAAAQARHQAARDRDREPRRWSTHRRREGD
jgi:hypothetical protein